MKSPVVRPVVFNVITVVAMMLALFWLLTMPPEATGPLLEQVEVETGLVDDALLVSLQENVVARAQATNVVVIAMIVAILSNIVANYLGRQRQKTNLARIAALETRLGQRQA